MERMRKEYIWALITLIVAILLAIILVNIVKDDASPQTAATKYCVTDEESRERVRGFLFAALDQALQDNFEHLFAVWMKDARGQPERARVGVGQAIEAHKTARILATEWVPPICPAKGQ